MSADSGPVTRYADSCGSLQVPGKTPKRSGSWGRSLGRWDWPWTTVKRGWIPGTGLLHGPQLGPRITGWSPGAQTGMLCIRFLSGWDCPQSVNAWGEVGSQGCLRICSWTDISSPASGDTDRQSSLQVPGKENHSLATTAKG